MILPRSTYAALETLVGKMGKFYIADDRFRLSKVFKKKNNFVGGGRYLRRELCYDLQMSGWFVLALGSMREPQSVVPVNIFGVRWVIFDLCTGILTRMILVFGGRKKLLRNSCEIGPWVWGQYSNEIWRIGVIFRIARMPRLHNLQFLWTHGCNCWFGTREVPLQKYSCERLI